MEEQQLTRKQRKALRKLEKQEQRSQQEQQHTKRRMTRWLLAGVLVVGVIGAFILGANSGDGEDRDLPSTDTAGRWVKGNADASVVIVEYSDFQCPACLAAQTTVDSILEKYGDRVRFEYRHFPLVSIHINGLAAARASEAAGKQNKFWEMHDRLFERQTVWATSDNVEEVFVGYAGELGLNVEQFRSDMGSSEVREFVNADLSKAQELGLNGTPTFFVNGEQLRLKEFSDLEKRVQELLGESS